MNISHERIQGHDDWLTPPELVRALGEFDLDPCYDEPRPWPTAKVMWGRNEDGLHREWFGFVWCNPPYGYQTATWLMRCYEHRRALALVFFRPGTYAFQKYIFPHAKGIFSITGRLRFYRPTGVQGGSAGVDSCLIAWDDEGIARIRKAQLAGVLRGWLLRAMQ